MNNNHHKFHLKSAQLISIFVFVSVRFFNTLYYHDQN